MRYFLFFIALIIALIWFFYFFDNHPKYVEILPKQWMYEQVEEDLSYYKKSGITDEMFDVAKEAIISGALQKVSIIIIENGIVSSFPEKQNKRASIIIKKIQNLIDQDVVIKDTKFLIGNQSGWNLMDQVPSEIKNKLPPVFVFARNKDDVYRHHYILFPDDHTLGNHLVGYRRGWFSIANEIIESRDKFLWKEKDNIAFWRGLDTDRENFTNREDSPRQKLIDISKEYSNIIDAKFNIVEFGNEFIVKNLRPLMQVFSIYPYISQVDQLKYKALINIDGQTATYPGLIWRLISGSVVLKQESQSEQWFYRILEPWKHYIPFDYYSSDIVEKTKWILENDSAAEEISLQAKEVIENNVMIPHIDSYIILLLNKYTEIYSSNP